MKCSFCGYSFAIDEGENACGSCPLTGNCHLIRCPHCGYEMPPEAKLVRWFRNLKRKKENRSTLIKDSTR
ncbi:MAG: hypothetical protein BGO78_15200 [Chloroflexi bacterium 44-23]|nr:MAG: hypothetical protein BGO78_15200 [Chloroflexi bacterium 44-23]